MSKLMRFTFKLLDLMIIFAMTFGSPIGAFAQDAGPILITDKSDYVPGDSIYVSGSGFVAGNYVLTATYPDGSIADWGVVVVDETLVFATTSPEPVTTEGTYGLTALAEDHTTVIATAGFTVTAPAPEPTVEPPTPTEPPAEPTPAPIPTIQSDKADYAPGELVTLTGTNWQGDTQVRIFINDDLGQTWSRDVTVEVAADGTIIDQFNLPSWFVATYVVSAGGHQTGRVVTTRFTDSQEDYKHYADKSPASWQNGALIPNNSQYFEGEVVPHYWKTDGLIPGQYYGFNVYYDYYDTSSGGFCGFDYMAQYNWSRYPPPLGSSPVPVYYIPGGPGALYAVGAQYINTAGPYNFGIQRFVQISFMATASKAEFYWGFHLAQPGALSGCQGSKAWPGASLQTDVRNTPQFTQYMLGGGGSLQINPGAIIRGTISGFKWNDQNGNGVLDGAEQRLSGWTIRLCSDQNCGNVLQTVTTDANGNYNFNVAPGTYFVREVQQSGWSQTYPGSQYYGATVTATNPTYSNFNFGNRQGSSITIVKDANPNDPQDFQFYGTFGTFFLDDDSDPVYSNSRTYSNLPPSGYTVGEYVPGNWVPSGVQCTGDNGNSIPQGPNQILIVLDPGENITCTFTNNKRGTIYIVKNTVGGDGTFNFTSSTLGNFSLTTTGNTAYTGFGNLIPGTYDVKETVPSGWDLTNATCDDGSNPSSISLQPGEKVTCTFTNTKQNPALTMDKTATPGTYSAVGQTINYSYLVTNSGNVKLAGPVIVSDNKVTVTCPNVDTVGNNDSFLDPGESITCTASYMITQADMNAGSVTNTATASAGGTNSNQDSETVTATQSPHIDLTKSVEETDFDAAGAVLHYTLIATNDGNVTLSNVSISDPVLGTLTCTPDQPAPLAPTETLSCTGTYTTSQSDVDAGKVDNTASVTGTFGNTTVTDTASVSVPATHNAAINLEKVITSSEPYDSVGDVITYQLVATNTGNVTLSTVSIGDLLLDPLTCVQPVTLAPTQSLTCIGSYTITQDDLNAGKVDNTATATGSFGNNDYTDTASQSVPLEQSLALTLVKTASPTTYSTMGQTITYSYEVKNSGNITLAGPFTVSDDKASVTCPATPSLAPGASITCSAIYTVTQADLDSGSVTNTATAANGTVTSNEATATVTATQSPALSLTKIASPATYDAVGQAISYSYEVKNTGNVTLSGPFTVSDNKATVTCPDTASLAVNASLTCSATHTITQADLDSGLVTNTAMGHGFFGTTPVDSNEDSETVNAIQSPALSLEKTAQELSYAHAGESIHYSYLVTNTGNVTLHDPIAVSDNKASVSCPALPAGGLAPGASVTCTATYTTTQADVDNGAVTNIASASSGTVTSPTDTVTVPAFQSPTLTLDKTADPATYDSVGDMFTYSYELTNSGNVTLSGPFTVTDDKTTATCEINQVVNPADVVFFDHFQNSTVASYTSGTLTYVDGPTGYGRAANFSPAGLWSRYQVPYWNAKANGGSIDLWVYLSEYKSSVQLVNFNWNNTSSYPPAGHILHFRIDDGKLIAGTWTWEPTPTITGNTVIPLNQWTHVAFTWGPGGSRLFVNGVEDAYSSGNIWPGLSTSTYVYVPYWGQYNPAYIDELRITNHVQASFGSILAPGDSTTCTASYTITQNDLDVGSVTNTAQGHAFFGETTVHSNNDSETVNAIQSPALALAKTASPVTYSTVGQTITYSYEVKNSGNITLAGPFTVSDDKASVTCPATANLAPGASITCSAIYTITQADLDSGSVTNTATATNGTVTSNQATATVTATQSPALSLTKIASPATFDAVGQAISYSYEVENTGNVTLSGPFIVSDNKATVTCPDTASLAPGASITCAASHTISQTDLDAGSVTNTAQGHAFFNGIDVFSNEDSETVDAIQNPSMTVAKVLTSNADEDGSGTVSLNDTLTYTITVTNTGNVTLHTVAVSDDLTGNTTHCLSVAPANTCVLMVTYQVTQADVDAGNIHNTGTADSDETPPTEDSNDVPVPQNPAIDLEKTVTSSGPYDSVGDVINYQLVATNTGNVTLSNVSIDDPLLDPLTCVQPVTLAPTQSLTCTGSYPLIQNDLDAGKVDNTATATGSFDGNNYTDTDGASVLVTQSPHISIAKSVEENNFDAAGDILHYTLIATNDGNVTLSNVSISDPLLGTLTCSQPVTLAPTQTLTCTGSYTISQIDVDAGKVDNTATTTGSFGYITVTDTDSASVPAIQLPSIMIEKFSLLDMTVVAPETRADVGDVIHYSFTVTNTGNVTLTNVNVTDALVAVNCTIGTMAPSAVDSSCTGSYTLTQVDLDAGNVHNQAFATGTDPNDDPTGDDDTNDQPIERVPAIDLVKTASAIDMTVIAPSARADAGDQITYSFSITNTGNVTLTGVDLTDALAGFATSTCGALTTLLPGESTSCSATYELTQADIDAGSVTNNATATGTPPSGNDASDSDTTTSPIPQLPSIMVQKFSSLDMTVMVPFTRADAGDVINYSFKVTNTGNVTLTTVTVTDALAGVNCTIGTVLPGAIDTTCPGLYTLTQADIDAGNVYNQVFVTATDPNDNPVDDDDTNNQTIPQEPALTVDKTPDLDSLPEPGGPVTFTVRVTNTGNITLQLTSLLDNVYGDIADNTNTAINSTTCVVPQTIPVGELYECTFNADVTGEPGFYRDTVDATANGVTASGVASVGIMDVMPAVDLTKAVIPATLAEPGGDFTFTLTITNNSVENVTITAITDDNVLSQECLDLVGAILAPTQTVSCTYTIPHTDAGSYDNSASVTVKDNEDNTASDSDDQTVTVTDVQPTVTLIKTADPTTLPEPGGVFTFTLTIINTSVEQVEIVSLSDNNALSAQCLALIGTTLAAGASTSCQYTITHTDAGMYPNTADVTVADNENNKASASDSEIVTVTDVPPMVSLDKSASPTTLPEPGGDFEFTIIITNTSVELVTITSFDDTQTTACNYLVNTVLGIGEFVTCTYIVAHTDADTYLNTASVTVVDNEGNEASASDDETVTVTDVKPTITVDKTADPTSVSETGENVTFTFVVTNTSVEPLTITSLTDSDFGTLAGDADCKVGTILPVGDFCDFSETHFISGDFESGMPHNNIFTAHAEDNEINDAFDEDDVTIEFTDVSADIAIIKVTVDDIAFGDGLNILTGESIQWRYTVTNLGNYPLSNIAVTDSKSGVTPAYISGDANGDNKLDSTETWIYEASGIAITNTYSNTGTAYGDFTDGAGNLESDTDSDGSSYFGADPQIAIMKVTVDGTTEGDGLNILTGETIGWKYIVTNTGNVTLSNVTVTDSQGVAVTCPKIILAVDESMTCTASGTAITDNYSNTGTASGRFIDSGAHSRTGTASDGSSYFGANPQLTINKITLDGSTEGDGLNILTGESIGWKYTVTNTGNVTLTNVTVTDGQGVTVTCPKTTLAVDESMTCTATGTATTGNYSNTGTASGTYTDSAVHSRTDTETDASSYFGADPQIAITKVTVDGTTSGDGLNILTGEAIKWRYSVANAGNIPLSNISVTDSVAGVSPAYVSGDTNGNNELDLTETWIFEASGTAVTGNYSNTGTAYGDFTDSNGDKRSDTETDGSSYFGADPQITITKVTIDDASEDDGLNILTGESISWKYIVANTGNVTLNNVSVIDSKGVTVACPKTALAVGESMDCTASGTAVTGDYSNTGTASGNYTDSGEHTRIDTATDTSSYFGANPQIDIVKQTVGSDGTEGDNVFILTGAAVTWKYNVTNTGNVILSNVTVNDSQSVAVSCPKTTLAVGESMTCTATGTNNTPIGTWYTNTGTATGTYTDDAGHSRTATDSDTSAYYSQKPGVVTNSMLCDFGNSFRLVFTPDVKYYTSSYQAYKLSDSNPGQFFYNVFQTGGIGTVTLTLPFPFVTQGATPIHVYSGLKAYTSNGQTCLQPTNEIKNYQTQITLSNFPANNYAGTTTVTLTGLPNTGFMYINIHLDYGLEKLNGWLKNGANAYYNTTINPTMPKVNIIDNVTHTFTSSIPNSIDSISNTNEFKRVKGFGGLVYQWNSTLQEYIPVEGAKVKVFKGTALTAANLKDTMTTDKDGWYLSTYVHTGKAATYTLALMNGNTVLKKITVTAGGSLKFGEGIFYIGGPTPAP